MRIHFITAIAALSLLAAPTAASAQADEKLRFFGSLNVAYGKSDNLGVDGIPKTGTSDYRAFTLQARYAISDADQFVVQLLSRKMGTSVLTDTLTANGAVKPVWAYYGHKFASGTSLKVGRLPLPRGIYNEVRFIGTLLPFYRVGNAVYGETLESLDGLSASRSWSSGSWGLDAALFTGGVDINVLLPGTSGQTLVKTRGESLLGTQLFLKTPVPGVRLGAFVSRYGTRGTPIFTNMYSLDGDWEKAFLKVESMQFLQATPTATSRTNYNAYYFLGGVRPTEKLTFSAMYDNATNELNFGKLPAPYPPLQITPARIDLPLQKDGAVGVSYKPLSNVAIKFEAHQRKGYNFDAGAPIANQSKLPSISLFPESKSNYGLISLAVTF